MGFRNNGGYGEQIRLKFLLKIPIIGEAETSSGSSFHIVGASKAKLEVECFTDL